MRVLDTFSAKKGQSGLPRPKVDSLNIIVGFGIEEDKFAGLHEDKAVMVVGLKAYELAKEKDISLKKGSLGENILFNFNPHEYSFGDIIKIGTVELEIMSSCTICNHLATFDKSLPILVKNHRGLYCKVKRSGIIKKDMPVEVKLAKKEN